MQGHRGYRRIRISEANAITQPPTKPLVLWPLPDQRHLYMLVVGVVLGVLLGPAVLGRVAPNVYDPMFVGSGDTAELDQAVDELQAFRDSAEEQKAEVEAILDQASLLDPNDSPYKSVMLQIDEKLKGYKEQEERLISDIESARIPIGINQQNHLVKLSGMTTVMLLLVVVLFAAEAILSPQRSEIEEGEAVVPTALPRLVTIRYALLAGWLLIMLAQPHWLQRIDPVFGGLLLVVVLVAGLVPLGKKAAIA